MKITIILVLFMIGFCIVGGKMYYTKDDLTNLKAKDLRKFLEDRGQPTEGILRKKQLIDLAFELQHLPLLSDYPKGDEDEEYIKAFQARLEMNRKLDDAMQKLRNAEELNEVNRKRVKLYMNCLFEIILVGSNLFGVLCTKWSRDKFGSLLFNLGFISVAVPAALGALEYTVKAENMEFWHFLTIEQVTFFHDFTALYLGRVLAPMFLGAACLSACGSTIVILPFITYLLLATLGVIFQSPMLYIQVPVLSMVSALVFAAWKIYSSQTKRIPIFVLCAIIIFAIANALFERSIAIGGMDPLDFFHLCLAFGTTFFAMANYQSIPKQKKE